MVGVMEIPALAVGALFFRMARIDANLAAEKWPRQTTAWN
jgi:hypothetical protein